ncbi:hypothetical protein FA15DRAFT_752708 [Coprinopsis marcescibilis]|uniref:Six-hairpin glycosidase n=1 Tax=Coprinopsis marcescibilis TaxID=230819 RepID=A0A5C3L8U7_COPMA|nr:hypothetical protein FA15DRAFT_752708 [Coprinopsis marcescibilis]
MLWLSRIAAFAAAFNGISNETISAVSENLLHVAHASWELGTAAQALTEAFTPGLSVFEVSAFPPPLRLNASSTPTDTFRIVDDVLARKPAYSRPLFANEGSSADPASLGAAVLLANWTRFEQRVQNYGKAASDQLDYLLYEAPRTNEGAISHRANEIQLWSDSVYMVPPFIAYFGALQKSNTLLREAYNQIRVYRQGLRDESRLWKHVVRGSWQDNTHWATGNAWAAAGMLRVLSTLNHSSIGHQFKQEQADLTTWVQEVLETSWINQRDDGAITNVIDNPSTFGDTASTALLAASTYRFATFTQNVTMIASALRASNFVQRNINQEGWLENAVNPVTFHTQLPKGQFSPEGQAFVLILHASWKAFVKSMADGSLRLPNRTQRQ